MENFKSKAKFPVYTGYREGPIIRNEQQAGEALEADCSARTFYLLRMWAFPQDTFFLVPNRDDGSTYTLFAVKTEEDIPKFRCPVGFGFVSNDLTKHLEIQFTFPRQRVFMSLFPRANSGSQKISCDGVA